MGLKHPVSFYIKKSTKLKLEDVPIEKFKASRIIKLQKFHHKNFDYFRTGAP